MSSAGSPIADLAIASRLTRRGFLLGATAVVGLDAPDAALAGAVGRRHVIVPTTGPGVDLRRVIEACVRCAIPDDPAGGGRVFFFGVPQPPDLPVGLVPASVDPEALRILPTRRLAERLRHDAPSRVAAACVPAGPPPAWGRAHWMRLGRLLDVLPPALSVVRIPAGTSASADARDCAGLADFRSTTASAEAAVILRLPPDATPSS